MKFTVKSMVLAAMLVAGSANAAAIVNVDQASGSDVFLGVYDYTNKLSSVFDLGSAFSFAAVTGGTAASQTFNLSADASWVSLVSATATTNLKWTVFAGAKTSTTPTSVLFETVNATSGAVAGSLYTQLKVNTQNLNIANFLNTAATKGLTQGGSIYTSGTTNAPFVGTSLMLGSTDKMAGIGSVIANQLDTFANVVTYSTTTNGPTGSTLTKFDPVVGFKLSSAGVLTYTALPVATNVPESDTYAMLLAGLGVMGFVARRRLAA